MNQPDSVKSLLVDLENRSVSRRSFVQRATALGLSASAVTMLLSAVGVAAPPAVAAAAQEAGGTMSFAVTSDPETLDPHMTSNPSASTVFDRIYSSLVYQEIDLSFQGLLAERWETSPDSLRITFYLRAGITFHDGSPLDAEAVKYTFERLATVGTKSPIYELVQQISGIEVIDPLTIAFVFTEPSATFINAIAGAYGGILSPSATEAAGADYGRQPVGTNAYQLRDWQTGSAVTLSAFPGFAAAEGFYTNKGAPLIGELAYKVIPEAFAQTASLETGEVDAVDLTATDLPRFMNDDRFEIFSSNSTGITYLGLTQIRPLMAELPVRQAIGHAINRDEIITTLYDGGLAESCFTPLPPSVPGYDPSLSALAPQFDLDAARVLLDQSGWIEGESGIREKGGQLLQPQLYTTTTTTQGQLATLIQGQLRQIGVDVQINQLEVAALLDFTPRGEHDMLLLGYSWSDPDALYLFLSSDRLQSSNRVHYSNPAFDELLRQGQRTLDPAARMQVYYEAQRLLLQDLPWIPLFMPIAKTAVAKRVSGVKVFPTGGLLLNDASIGG